MCVSCISTDLYDIAIDAHHVTNEKRSLGLVSIHDGDWGVLRPRKVVRSSVSQCKQHSIAISRHRAVRKLWHGIQQVLLVGQHRLPRPGEVLALEAALARGLLKDLASGESGKQGVEGSPQPAPLISWGIVGSNAINDLPEETEWCGTVLLLL